MDAQCEAAARYADPAVRARSLSALGPAALGALGVLIDATHGSDSEIARAAVEALGHLEGAAAPALPALVRALRNEDRVVRDWSTLRDGAETVPRDWHVVEPKGNWLAVRTAAAHSLGAIGAERPELALAVLSDLDRVARGDDPTLAAAASGAAARIRAAAE